MGPHQSHFQALPLVGAIVAACLVVNVEGQMPAAPSQDASREASKAFASVGLAAKVSKSGLETAKQPIGVRIEKLTPDAEIIGVTAEGLRTQTERRLRQAGIPAYWKGWPELDVRVTVAGAAFSVDVSFVRDVLYSDGTNVWKKIAVTWNRSNAGTHLQNPESLVSALDQLLDQFVDDFLKANPK